MLHSFDHPDLVHYVALQPTAGLIAGNILATACQDGLLRLFDMRRNAKGDIPPKSLYSCCNNYVRLIAHRVLISYFRRGLPDCQSTWRIVHGYVFTS